MMSDSKVRGAVALRAEELAWTDGAPELVWSVSTLVGEVDHDSLEWFGLADSSRPVFVGLQLSIACEELTAIAANRVAMLDGVGAQRCLRTERGVAEALVWRHGGLERVSWYESQARKSLVAAMEVGRADMLKGVFESAT
jgi:hypothetical protein